MELLSETFIVFRENLDEARHHIGHALAHAAGDLHISADIDLGYAIDALKRAREKLGLDTQPSRKTTNEKTKDNL